VQDVNPETKLSQTTRSTAYAQQMQYDDALRKVTYTTKAHLIGPQGDLTADTIVVTFGENKQDIELLEAAVGVTMKQPERITTGEQLTYVAAKEEYTVVGKGKLVRTFQRTEQGECRRSEGSLLTFTRGADSLQLTGRDDSRSQTAPDTSCPPPQKR
jgi:hypothetical protein